MITDENSLRQADDQLMDEAEDLIWAFLDERIERGDAQRLEEMIKENDQVRLRYMHCAQVHANLYEQYQTKTSSEVENLSPVLGSIGNFSMSLGGPSSVTD